MSFFFRQKPQQFFSDADREKIVAAIQKAEQNTSGEIRVFIENHCEYVDSIDRAREIFGSLKMEQTALRNGVLLYLALKDKQLSIFGDQGIHQKVGTEFWEKELGKMISFFQQEDYANGIANIIIEIGRTLSTHFPYDARTDKNELPDDIVFGK